MSRRILPPQEPQRSTTSLHNSPQTRAAFSSNRRAIFVVTPLTSLLLASSIHPPPAIVSSKPLRRRCTRQLFQGPPPSLAPFRIAKSYNFPRPHQEFRAPPASAPRNAQSPFATPYPAPLLDFRLTLENLSPSEASLPPPRITSINIKVDTTNKA